MERIAKDGNCFFRAIEHQLSLNGIKESHEIIRFKTVKFIEENSEEFFSYVEDNNITNYVKCMYKVRVWADYVAIYGMTRAYNLTLLFSIRQAFTNVSTQINS